jgi:hypothetical protein
MDCTNCRAQLPSGAGVCPRCGAAAPPTEGYVDTAGGAFVGGDVKAGGDFVGRDQMIHGNYTRTSQQGLSGTELSQLFQSIYRQIRERPPNSHVDREELVELVQRIERETARGKQADHGKLRRWLGNLGSLAPDIFELLVTLLHSNAHVDPNVQAVVQQAVSGGN